jgi:hypothetical protein
MISPGLRTPGVSWRKRRLQPLPNMARRRTRELGQEGQVEYRKVRTEPMIAQIQAGTYVLLLSSSFSMSLRGPAVPRTY